LLTFELLLEAQISRSIFEMRQAHRASAANSPWQSSLIGVSYFRFIFITSLRARAMII
jgi:hypothetical protein